MGGRMMLDKIKDQAKEVGELKTLLIEAWELIVEYGCSCGSVNAVPHCKRCQMLTKIDTLSKPIATDVTPDIFG